MEAAVSTPLISSAVCLSDAQGCELSLWELWEMEFKVRKQEILYGNFL